MADGDTQTWDYILKYCILGDAGVGKTSLLFRLTQPGEPLRAPEPTIGVDFGSKVLEVGGGRRVKVQCWDTAGAEAFRSITRSYFRGSAGALLVFDVTERSTFDNLQTWLKDLRAYAEPDVAIMLVANKTDLCADESDDAGSAVAHPGPSDSDEVLPLDDSALSSPPPPTSTDARAARATSRAEARAFAQAEGMLYVETSAKDGSGVDAAFARTAREVLGRMRARGEVGKGGKQKDIVRIGEGKKAAGGCC